MQTTDTQTIRAAIITAIHAITPRCVHLRESCPWGYVRNEDFAAGSQCRRYTIEESVAKPDHAFYSNGESYLYRLDIRAAYSGVPLTTAMDMLTLDGVDLREAIDNLRDPTVPGFAALIFIGADPGLLDTDGAEVVYMFTVQYLQNTGLH